MSRWWNTSGIGPILMLGFVCMAGLAAVARAAETSTPCAPAPAKRTALVELERSGFAVTDAGERQRRALELVDCLGDPDPALRDGVAFGALFRWLRANALDDATRLALAVRLLPMVEADEDADGFRRSFAALALGEVVRADGLKASMPAPVRLRVVDAAVRFLTTTRDYRGFDPTAGWRHAVAHGADLAKQIALHPATTEPEARRLLEALASQVTPPGVSYVFGEPERIADAVHSIHTRGLVDDAVWDRWFSDVGAKWRRAEGPAAYRTLEGLARRHDLRAFLHAVGFTARTHPGAASERLDALAQRELLRMQGA